jgi:lactoylglutathione lyase
MPLAVDSVVHIALRVKDLERSLSFYRETLGFLEMSRSLYSDGSVLCVYVRASERQFIEIFPAGVGESAPDESAVGIIHFCLAVPDVNEARVQLVEMAVAIAKELDTPDGTILFFHDPDGNVLEIKGRDGTAAEWNAADAVAAGERPVIRRTPWDPPVAHSPGVSR